MANEDNLDTKLAVLSQVVKDIERRLGVMEQYSKVVVLLVLTTVITTVMKAVGVGG